MDENIQQETEVTAAESAVKEENTKQEPEKVEKSYTRDEVNSKKYLNIKYRFLMFSFVFD